MDNWLASKGFLPGYAFGGDTVKVQLKDPDDDFMRPPETAIREFGLLAMC
jgi:hypothetical protein